MFTLDHTTTYRIFPADYETASLHFNNLDKIVSMVKAWSPVRSQGPAAGYTYWGQFLAHELAPRPIESPTRTSALDLDSVYGGGWEDLRLPVCTETGKILLADTKGGSPLRRDFLRVGKKILAPEPRNDENLIIAQFHILLIRFHNAVIDCLSQKYFYIKDKNKKFDIARIVVTKIFQYITKHDYLNKMCTGKVYSWVVENNNSIYSLKPDELLPVEAVMGFMRFGHAQVRDDYDINKNQREQDLAIIFENSGRKNLSENSPLPTDMVIDWKFFFNVKKDRSQGASSIQPRLAGALAEEFDLIKKNILAGIRNQLPSGQKFLELISNKYSLIKDLGVEPISFNVRQYRQLKKAGIYESIPLWIYVLLDAESSQSGGAILGPLGSLLVASTINNCINNHKIAENDVFIANIIDSLNIHSIGNLIDTVEIIEKKRNNNDY